MRGLAGVLVLLAMLAPRAARAVQLEAIEGGDWKLRALRFRGNEAIKGRALKKAMVTKPRPWFTIWRERPPFDPIAFRTDLERLRRLYQSRGYYHALVAHDIELPAEGNAVTAVVHMEEGEPVLVERVDVTFGGEELPADEQARLLTKLPIETGRIFTEEDYAAGLTYLRAYYREHAFARVQVTREAAVDVAQNRAAVSYHIASGPRSVFGPVEIAGTRKVDPEVIRRELAFDTDDPFRQSRLDETRDKLAALNLFRSIRFEEDEGVDPRVDLRVRVDEAPPREVRFGVGYDTEEEIRGLASWRHYNFFGDGRQLGFTARASVIERALAADFLQPHFPGRDNRTRLLFLQTQEEEDTFDLDRTRFSPRFEWQASRRVTGFVFHRTEYDALSDVSEAVEARLMDPAEDGVLSGLGIGVDWNRTDDLLDPKRGFVTNLVVEPVGGFLGGDFDFVRVVGEGRIYQPLVGDLLGAARLRIGAAEPTGSSDEIPLFERFYSGGLNSVRGYGRRRIGPLEDDDPIGGRTLVEASVELRHPITKSIGVAVFLDGGQVGGAPGPRRGPLGRIVPGSDVGCGGGDTRRDPQSFEFRFDDLCYGSGFGARYKSPIGLLRLDLGFPFDPPPGDAPWQVHFSLGAAF
jgi:outer membrane protein assembly complex protein YaeT